MGGSGSGRWRYHIPKDTVEDCLVLSASMLLHRGLLRAGLRLTAVLRLGGLGQVGYGIDTIGPEPFVCLQYGWSGGPVAVDIRLTTTPLPWGGFRWWFRCPVTIDGHVCGRRCSKLYIPPASRHLGCRLCHDLTYTSAQEAHQDDAIFAAVAANLGVTPKECRMALRL